MGGINPFGPRRQAVSTLQRRRRTDHPGLWFSATRHQQSHPQPADFLGRLRALRTIPARATHPARTVDRCLRHHGHAVFHVDRLSVAVRNGSPAGATAATARSVEAGTAFCPGVAGGAGRGADARLAQAQAELVAPAELPTAPLPKPPKSILLEPELPKPIPVELPKVSPPKPAAPKPAPKPTLVQPPL